MFAKRKHIGREDSLPWLTAMWLEGLLSLQESSKRIEETQTIQVPLPGKHVVSGLQEIKWTNASDTVDSQIGESASQKGYILDTSCNIEPNSATTSTCQNHHTIPHNTTQYHTLSNAWPFIFGQLVYKLFGLAQSTDRKQYHDCMELCLTGDDSLWKDTFDESRLKSKQLRGNTRKENPTYNNLIAMWRGGLKKNWQQIKKRGS